MEDLLKGLEWLKDGGRLAARELWEVREQLDDYDEAIEWLLDIREGTKP